MLNRQICDDVTVDTRIRFGDVLGGCKTGVVVEVLNSPITGRPRAFVVRLDDLATVAVIVEVEEVVSIEERR